MSSSSSSSVYTEVPSDEEESSSYPDADSTTLQYWRRVTGNDLMHILKINNYDDGAIVQFVRYFLKNIPPAWGFVSSKNSTNPDQLASSLNLDNSPVEIGLTYTAKYPNPVDRPPIRLIAEVDHLTASKSLDEYCRRNVGGCIRYEMDWADSLYRSIMKDGGSTYFGDVRVGFDIRPALRRPEYSLLMPPGPGPIPADATAYLLASRKAQHQGITRWVLIRQSILDLPGIDGYKYQQRRIVAGVKMVDDFLAEYPPEFGNLISIVDIGPEHMDKARIGLSFTVPAGDASADFGEVWKWLTLGGRITKLARHSNKSKVLTQTFFDMVHGVDSRHAPAEDTGGNNEPPTREEPQIEPYLDRADQAKAGTLIPQVAPCSVYFCLAYDTPEPTATLRADVTCGSRTDYQIAESFGSFLKYLRDQEWPEPFPNFYPGFVPQLFPGLPLAQDPWLRLHTSVSFCCQEGGMGRRDDWTLRASYNPLYYRCARP